MSYLPSIPVPVVHMPSIQAIHMPSMNLMAEEEDKLARDEESRQQRLEVLERQKKNTFYYTIKQAFASIAGPLTGGGLGLFVAGMIGAPQETTEALETAVGELKTEVAGLNEAWQTALEADKGIELAQTALDKKEDLLDARQELLSDAIKADRNTTAGLTMMGGALVANAASLGANAIGAKYSHAANFDQFEINAQHTGKEVGKAIRKELEEMQAEREAGIAVTQHMQPVFVFDNPDAERKDGKSWQEHVDEQRLSGKDQHISNHV